MIKRNKIIKPIIFLTISLLILVLSPIGCKKKNHPPTTPTTPEGATSTYTNRTDQYTTTATDPDGNSFRFVWSLNDTKIDTTDENYIDYFWANTGTQAIKVKAIDDKGAESQWSSALSVTVIYNSPPTINTVSGPDFGMVNQNINFSTVAYDSTDSVQVKFIYRKKSSTTYDTKAWSGLKLSGSTFTDSIKFPTGDTYIVRALAKDAKGSLSDTALPHTIIFFPPRIDPINGPVTGWLNQFMAFSTIARDTFNDSVYVRFIYRKKSVSSYTQGSWIGPKASGSNFQGLIQFTTMDSYIIRAVAKNKQGSYSDTTPPHNLFVPGWGYNTPDETEFFSSPALAQIDGEWVLFIGGVDGYFYAIKAADGTQKWAKRSIFDPTSTPFEPEDVFYASPAVNQNVATPHVYCGGESGELYAYLTPSGTQWDWRYPDSSYDGLTYNEISSSVAVSGSRLYVGINTGYGNDYRLYAIQDNGGTCSYAWSYPTGCDIVSSPAVDATGNIFFGDDSGYVTCLNQNGGLIWRRRISTSIYTIYASPAIGPNALYVGTDDGFLFALNRSSPGTQIWRYPSTGTGLEGVRSSPVIGSDGTIYFGCDDGQLYAVTSNGQLKSGFPVFLSDGAVTSTPAIAQDGTIVMYTEEDMVYGINPSGTIKWQVPLPGWSARKKSKIRTNKSKLDDIIPSPTIGPDGTIYVASVQQGVYALKGTTNNPLASTSWPKFRYDIQNTGKSTQ